MAGNAPPPGQIASKLGEAQVLVEQWRRHYHQGRPHSALGYRPPAPAARQRDGRRPMVAMRHAAREQGVEP